MLLTVPDGEGSKQLAVLGELWAQMAEAGLDRGKVMITNTVKCRPPGNRRPKAEEMAACRPFLQEELKGKRFILALGLSAAEDLLGKKMVMKEVCNRPVQADQWWLYDQISPTASGARGFSTSRIFQNGALGASATQEGLLRPVSR